ncbi:extracellular solute-binding protein [Herbiconiux sp. KACC 21604]|uniref:ABC transporter substrate-binding protein n=1 Tax=unclassified Herbiconiux TaxID=2618217 RepID=UPI0014922325|nr:extracellular solute-binding protein [Herbiconiux sp. SALV-R1]QJU55166.1 extracellular solute-binding protein [Herbiconiux sp. SALV-R1]WPO86323.1 extracellular solute-binding protein [Herbiconiux sp. KACC 21604]
MKPRTVRRVAAAATAAILGVTLAACTGSSDSSADKVTITVAGPNQWNSDPSSFGPEWEAQVARFEELEPDIDVETTVLPLSSFSDTLATQLSAGTAPELVFNQAPHQPYMVHSLNDYLAAPNPYVEGNEAWIDVFNPDLFGPNNPVTYNTEGNNEFIPFNVFIPVIYYNAEIFEEVGVEAPIETWADLVSASEKLKAAGYTPFAADNAPQGLMWTLEVIADQLVTHAVYDTLNVFDAKGEPGTNNALTSKDWARGVLTGEVKATEIPQLRESLELLKQFYTDFATPNWSGVTGTGAAVINQADFVSGKAAMAWGSSFGYSTVQSEADFTVSAMPFPTITSETTEYADGINARYGASIYGTAYVIPANIEGPKLDAAVKFLQYMTAPDKASEWLADTGSLSALNDAAVPENLQAFTGSDWLQPRQLGGAAIYPPEGTDGQDLYGGYLLGTKDTDQMLADLQASWEQVAAQNVKKGGWTEDWAQG